MGTAARRSPAPTGGSRGAPGTPPAAGSNVPASTPWAHRLLHATEGHVDCQQGLRVRQSRSVRAVAHHADQPLSPPERHRTHAYGPGPRPCWAGPAGGRAPNGQRFGIRREGQRSMGSNISADPIRARFGPVVRSGFERPEDRRRDPPTCPDSLGRSSGESNPPLPIPIPPETSSP